MNSSNKWLFYFGIALLSLGIFFEIDFIVWLGIAVAGAIATQYAADLARKEGENIAPHETADGGDIITRLNLIIAQNKNYGRHSTTTLRKGNCRP